MTQAQHQTIVVGVDGSEHSVEALRWALRQARLTGAELRAVSSWQLPIPYDYMHFDNVDWEGETMNNLDRTLAEVAADVGDTKVTKRVVRGHAGTVLVDESEDADLLVVGSRGHGTAKGMLLGSISQHCVTNASGPVVVIRPRNS